MKGQESAGVAERAGTIVAVVVSVARVTAFRMTACAVASSAAGNPMRPMAVAKVLSPAAQRVRSEAVGAVTSVVDSAVHAACSWCPVEGQDSTFPTAYPPSSTTRMMAANNPSLSGFSGGRPGWSW
jgi:hypothetical protein